MQDICFVTSNTGKVASINQQLAKTRYTLVQRVLDTPELQADTALEIATHKAKFAYKKLDRPVVVQDSAFNINALSGFPGPYIKYINETIGVKGILRLMEGKEDRTAYFEQALVYIDQMGEVHSFTSTEEAGNITKKPFDGDYEHSWSDLWRIYTPRSATKTLAELYAKEEHIPKHKTEIIQFIEWLERQS